MKRISMERFIEGLGAEVYPITLTKFMLNRRRILNYFEKASEDSFELRTQFSVNHDDCEFCKQKENEGVLCRQHTSIRRVLEADKVAFDLDTQTYFFKNEIYRMVGPRLVIVYCPHPKLISGQITDQKVRRVKPITIEDPQGIPELPQYENVKSFISSSMMDQNFVCWFNDEFSLVTLPEDRNKCNFCLIPNH
jgi:hypothetical protein